MAGFGALSCPAPGWMGGRPGMHLAPAPAVSNVGAAARPWREGMDPGTRFRRRRSAPAASDGHAQPPRRVARRSATAARRNAAARPGNPGRSACGDACLFGDLEHRNQDRHGMASTPHDLHRLAAFTDDPRGGNPAGVWIGQALPPADYMQRVAAEVGYSETAFLAPGGDDAWEVRYFSPL